MPTPSTTERFVSGIRALVPPSRERQFRAEVPTVGGDGQVAVIRLYDPIDSWGEWWGVSAKEFASVLDELPDSVTEIRLMINSPGGEVFDGIAILNLLRNHKAKVVAVVEGLAASAASFVAVGSDELVMGRNAELMIHDAWGVVVGNAEECRRMSEDLDRLSDNIASIYADKAGGELADWRAAMERETWYSAEEAVEAGLADRVDEKQSSDDDAKNRFDLSIFNFAGRTAAPAPRASATPPSPRPASGPKGVSVTDLTAFREALGLADDITDDAIVDALGALPDPEGDDPPKPPAPALPEGVVAVDAATLEQLKADASAGRKAHDDQVAARREQLVKAAVDDGRIAPARRQAWLDQLAADPGAEEVLAKLATGTIPVELKGHGGETDLDADDALYVDLFGKEEVSA